MVPKNINPLIAEVKEYLRISLPSRGGNPFSEEFEFIKSKLMSYDIIRANYTDDDIYGALTLSIIFREPSFEITDKFAEEVVNSFFDVTAEDCVYVPLEEMNGFPSGYKIGTCTIITSEELPKSIKNVIHPAEKHLDDPNYLSDEIPLPKYWIYTSLDSVGQMKQKE
ncbi:MAG: hypothetical protein ABFC34_00265 [Methanobacterium sp.]